MSDVKGTNSWGKARLTFSAGMVQDVSTPGKYFPTGSAPANDSHGRPQPRRHPEIVNLDDDTVSILPGDGHGGLRSASGSPFPAGAKPWQVAIDEVNSDDNPDLIVTLISVTSPTRPRMPSFSCSVTATVGSTPRLAHRLLWLTVAVPNSVAAGDLTGDGTQSIVVACGESRSMLVYYRGYHDLLSRLAHAQSDRG